MGGDVSNVKYFLEYKYVDVNMQDSDGWTPLWCAAFYNDVEVMKYLLSKGADVHVKAKNRFGWYEAQLLKQGDDVSPEKMRILQEVANKEAAIYGGDCLVIIVIVIAAIYVLSHF